MIHRKFFICVITAFALSACATKNPLPDATYYKIADFSAQAQRCFESDLISPKEMADARMAVSYSLSTWVVDSSKFNSVYQGTYGATSADPSSCREFQAQLMQLQGEVLQRKSNNAQAAQELNSMGKALGTGYRAPMYCQRYGQMVTCN